MVNYNIPQCYHRNQLLSKTIAALLSYQETDSNNKNRTAEKHSLRNVPVNTEILSMSSTKVENKEEEETTNSLPTEIQSQGTSDPSNQTVGRTHPAERLTAYPRYIIDRRLARTTAMSEQTTYNTSDISNAYLHCHTHATDLNPRRVETTTERQARIGRENYCRRHGHQDQPHNARHCRNCGIRR